MADSHENDSFTEAPTDPIETRYFCHQCKVEVRPISTPSSELTCPRCNDGFIEELGPTYGRRENNVTDAAPPPSFLAQGAHGHTHMHNPRPGTFVLSMSSAPATHRRGRTAVPILFPSGLMGFPTAQPGDGGAPPPAGFEALLNLLGNLGGVNISMPGVHGNPGDYVWGAGGLDAIITQLLNNVEGAGPPPAHPERIEKLPTVKITSIQVENNVQCSVCFDDFTLAEEVKVLPCEHHYHRECIVPWLEMHGTCPVCRIDLNGSDTTTTEFDANIGETIGSIDTEHTDEEEQSAAQNSNNSAMYSLDSPDNNSGIRQRRSHMRDDDID